MNNATLLGRLTKQPELKQTQSGQSFCTFTLAIDRKYKNQDGTRDTDFIPCVAWRHTAEFIAKYFHKGERMAVTGEIRPRSWEDDTGQRRYMTEVIVDQAYFADGKRDSYSAPSAYDDEPDLAPSDTDLPFDLS